MVRGRDLNAPAGEARFRGVERMTSMQLLGFVIMPFVVAFLGWVLSRMPV
jgi:hypothetical protein